MPIFDQGYQHWSGTLTGHAWRWLTIARQGVRVGMKNLLLRLLVIVAWLPAAVLAFVLCLWGLLENKSPLISSFLPLLSFLFPPEVLADPRHYRVAAWTVCFSRFLAVELYFAMLVVLLVGPGLISQDLRFNALPLYFSRPLRRIDYFAGKMGVIAYFLGLVIVLPSLLAYALGMLFSLDITILWDTFPLLLSCLAYGVVIVLSAGSLVLALSALTRNSRYVALSWIGLWFVTSTTAGILNTVAEEQRRYEMYRKQELAYKEQGPGGPPGEVDGDDRQPDDRGPGPGPRGKHEPGFRDDRRGPRPPRQAPDWRKAEAEYEEEVARASHTNWRPLLSYTANLSRIGQALLQTDAAWEALIPERRGENRAVTLGQYLGPQYPWFWSAGVLAVLFGLSACTLNYRIRSLDRLK